MLGFAFHEFNCSTYRIICTSCVVNADIELWNLEEGLKDSFINAYAIVSNDGSIYWTRPGHLRPACKFYGLDNFPFDRLTCTMEFGSWVYSGKYLRPVKGGGGGALRGEGVELGLSGGGVDFDNPWARSGPHAPPKHIHRLISCLMPSEA